MSLNSMRGMMLGSMVSLLAHAGAGAALYGWFFKQHSNPIVAELDLSLAPLVPIMPNAGGGRGAKQPESWILPRKGKKAPVPQVPVQTETKEQVVREEAQTAPCEGDCAQEPVVGQGWGGGSGEGDGQFVPAEATSRKPRWIRNFITSRDYPLIARQKGKDGRVVLTVLIDNEGRVRDVRLLQGSYEALNEVALRKVREAVFTPAYDDKNKSVSCKVTLPIRFELR